MGGMMGAGMGASIALWIVLGLVVAVAAGVMVARALSTRRQAEVGSAEPSAVQEAKDALRLRYAKGEIGREEYLQGKVELED